MKPWLILSALFVAASSAQTQAPNDPKTPASAPHFVAEHANSVSWNPDGSFLGFSYRDRSGRVDDLGLYDLGRSRGKVLLRPGETDRVEQTVWLAGAPIELVCTAVTETVDRKPMERRTLWALDGTGMTAKQLWSAEYPAEQHPRIFVDPSPSLTHAIVSVKTDAATTYFVVTLGGDGVEMSPDISQAIGEGYGFAGWTVDGTGFFGKGIQNDLVAQVLELTTLYDEAQGSTVQGLATINSDSGMVISGPIHLDVVLRAVGGDSGNETAWTISPARPAIPVGTVGLELMPTNGVLRPVKFRGFWEGQPEPPQETALVHQDEPLKFKDSSGSTKSIWLKPNVKDAKTGQLISPEAEQAWLHPDGKTVAFTINGVLFVRTLKASH